MSPNKTYIHYPADRLIEGKLWPHRIEMPTMSSVNLPANYSKEDIQRLKESDNRYLKLALANSIPFDKEFVEQIMDYLEPQFKSDRQRLAKVQGVGESTIASYGLDINSEKIYEIEGIETAIEEQYNWVGHLKNPLDDCITKVIIIKQAKEEPQESQEELWNLFMEDVEYQLTEKTLNKVKKLFHIQRK